MSRTCAGCNQVIEGSWYTAMGKDWHPEHFVCAQCKQPLQSQTFNVQDGKPYCKKDYTELFSKKCKHCGEPITGTGVVALGSTWHPEHLFCAKCKKVLETKQFFERDGLPFCKDCYEEKFSTVCAICQKPISDTIITALDKSYHKECFKCAKCQTLITGNSFGVEDGKPLCEKCTTKKCPAAGKKIRDGNSN